MWLHLSINPKGARNTELEGCFFVATKAISKTTKMTPLSISEGLIIHLRGHRKNVSLP